MQFKNYSHDIVAELLLYLAENESFASLNSLGTFTRSEVKNLLKDMAEQLKEQSNKHPIIKKDTLREGELHDNVHRVISRLSPHEENVLLKSFKIA